MIPHTLVLKPALVIYRIYNGCWFWGRPSVADLWHDLRAVTTEIRPDWDLSTPGLREAWNAGGLPAFHGWNKGTTAAPIGRKEQGDAQTTGRRPLESGFGRQAALVRRFGVPIQLLNISIANHASAQRQFPTRSDSQAEAFDKQRPSSGSGRFIRRSQSNVINAISPLAYRLHS